MKDFLRRTGAKLEREPQQGRPGENAPQSQKEVLTLPAIEKQPRQQQSSASNKTKQVKNTKGLRRTLLALLPVLMAFLVQLTLWPVIRPLAWFLFYPAVFFSSWIGGRRSGIFATVISTLLVWYFFLLPERSFVEPNVVGVMSSLMFLGTGLVFSLFHDRLRQANQRVTKALAAVQAANDQLEKRVQARTTELAQSQEMIRESEERATGIIESAMDAIVTIDAGQRIVLFNPAAEQMFQCPATEAIGQPLDRLIPERFRPAHRQHIADFGQTRVTKRRMGALGAVYGLRADGAEFPVEASISQIEAHGQKLFTVILRDITQRKRNEERLIEQAALLNEAQEAILVRDLDNRIRYWSRGAERLYGWTAEEAIGRTAGELLYAEDASPLVEATRLTLAQGAWNGELRHTTKEGRKVIVEGHWTLVRDAEGKPKTILAINTDVTEKRKIEAQFLRAQRLESLGTLAGGIAHDLNNILSPVLMGVQMLQMKLTDANHQHWLEIMRGNIERGAAMVKQILLFAKGVQGKRVPLQPKHLIREIVKILGETLPKSIAIKFSLPEDLALVTGDATQLHQVLMNLCVNARDAMPNGGRLLIEAANITIDPQYAGFVPDAQPGPYVQIAISDTGTGIPDELKDKIFDPFFTTKELGQGTGLGLSTVLGIIKSHNGFIQVYSEVGKGTKFTLYLPVYTTEQKTQTPITPAALPTGHGELILVVDDEAAVREITRTTLETFGYRVVTASDGTEALAVYARHRSEIQAVLTDMMMPYLDGPATIRALQKMNPDLKVIASSGLAEQEKVNEVTELGVKYFLAKPYAADQLLKTLAQVLSDGPA